MNLYQHQIDSITQLLAGKRIIIAETGVGKGAISVKWAEEQCKKTNKDKVLVVTTASKAHMKPSDFEEDIKTWCSPNFLSGITLQVISWAKLSSWVEEHQPVLSKWVVILDECLPADTKVKTQGGEKDIADLCVGDKVLSYNHHTCKTEYKKITRIIRKEAPKEMYRLRLSDGTTIISTGNHPHWTQDGYKEAKDIKRGELLYEMHSMWQDNNQRIDTKAERDIKNEGESILFGGVRENVWDKTNERTMAKEKSGEIWGTCKLCYLWKRNRCERNATTKSIKLFKHKSVLLLNILCKKAFRRGIIKGSRDEKKEWVQTSMDRKARVKRWQWELFQTTKASMGKTQQSQQRLGDGTTREFRKKNTRLSNMLQIRHWQHLPQNRNRVRWGQPQFGEDKGEGQEEGNEIKGVRVESIEIHKLGDIKRLGLYRDPNNVYCIDVEDNHNFFANGILTHNCAYVKAGVSSGRGRAFLKLARYTSDWSGFTATPGETWLHHYPYFQACGLVRNKTSFLREYAVVQNYKGYPEVVEWKNEGKLKAMWAKISYAPDTRKVLAELPEQTHKVITFKKPKDYSKVLKTRYKDDEFLDTTMKLCHTLRQMCFTKEKQGWIRDFVENLGDRLVIFYSYIEEGDKLEEICKKVLPKNAKIWRIDGKHHEIPTEKDCGERDVVLCQWQSGSEGLNLQFVSYWLSVSPTYSYTTSIQARGRVRRIGSKKPVFYYYLKCENCIESDIYKALKNKQDFAVENWCISNQIIEKGE